MYNSKKPSDNELPTTKQLIKSTLIAFVAAVILLMVVVYPAEYGVDPTGLGEKLGLKKMGEIKTSLMAESQEEEKTEKKSEKINSGTIDNSNKNETSSKLSENSKQEKMEFTLKPDQAVELKATMKKGDIVEYTWMTNQGKANFDVHGDSEALKINYHNYEKGSLKEKKGIIEAAFDGNHGWFWRNRSGRTLTITIEVSGQYEVLKRVL